MGNIKQISIKNRTDYFFNDMINIKDFDSSPLKIDKKSYKNIGINMKILKISINENINIVNPLYLIITGVDGYIEENNGNKNMQSFGMKLNIISKQ